MQHRDRLWATAVVWVGVTLIMLGLITAIVLTGSHMSDTGAISASVVALFLLAIGGYSTSRIWRGAEVASPALPQSAARPEKTKRGDPARIARLIEQLDQDDMIELETLLMARSDATYNQE